MKYVALDMINGKNVIGIWDEEYTEDKNSMRIIMPMQINRHTIFTRPGHSSETVAGSPYLLFSDDLVVLFPMSRVVSASNLSEFSKKLYMSLLNRHHNTFEFIQAGVFDLIKKDMTDFLQENEDKLREQLKEEQEEEMFESSEESKDTSNRILH
jgi:hypothetical protein